MKTTTNRAWALLAATALLAPAALQGQSGVPHVSSGIPFRARAATSSTASSRLS